MAYKDYYRLPHPDRLLPDKLAAGALLGGRLIFKKGIVEAVVLVVVAVAAEEVVAVVVVVVVVVVVGVEVEDEDVD